MTNRLRWLNTLRDTPGWQWITASGEAEFAYKSLRRVGFVVALFVVPMWRFVVSLAPPTSLVVLVGLALIFGLIGWIGPHVSKALTGTLASVTRPTPELLFALRMPGEVLPGHIDGQETRYLPRVWIVKHSEESRVLEFRLWIPGYSFMAADSFQEIFQARFGLDEAYFSNPLDVSWPSRQRNLAFITTDTGGDDSMFLLSVRDVRSGHTFVLGGDEEWGCHSDGSCSIAQHELQTPMSRHDLILTHRNSLAAIRDLLEQYVEERRLAKDMMSALSKLVSTQLRMRAEFFAAGIVGLGTALESQLTVETLLVTERQEAITQLRSMVDALDGLLRQTS